MKKSVLNLLRLPAAIAANSVVTTSQNTGLPPLSPLRTPSFWAVVVSVICGVGSIVGVDVLAAFGLTTETELVNLILQLVGVGAGVWAWIERRAPRYRLVLGGAGDD